MNSTKKLNQNQPVLFLIGPSGVGKSSVLRELSSRKIIELTPSWTTRPPRNDETVSSIEHKFISETDFFRLESDGFFLKIMQLFDLPYRFGLPYITTPLDKAVPAVVLRTYLVADMLRHYPNSYIYAIEDEFDRVEARLNKRLSEGEPLGSRLEEYNNEISQGRKITNRVFTNNSSIKDLAKKIETVLKFDF